MSCENCKNAEMVRSVLNYVPQPGYSTLLQYQCPECDFKFMKVA